ncbi:MAG: hypothetical protein PVF91_15780 [Chromatiales bacterium]
MHKNVKSRSMALLGLLVVLGSGSAPAETGLGFEPVAKAPVEECFVCQVSGCLVQERFAASPQDAQPATPYIPVTAYPIGERAAQCEAMDDPADLSKRIIPKRNGAYLWGLTVAGAARDKIWIGSAPNIPCVGGAASGTEGPYVPGTLICESGKSNFPGIPDILRPIFGDWRPPGVFVYDTGTGIQTEVEVPHFLINWTQGLRSAGTTPSGVVLLAGPALLGVGINVFAFDGETREFLGAKRLWRYSNIRKWIQANGALYTTVQKTRGGTGSVLRWVGSRDRPFELVEVGRLDGGGVNIALHEGRLYVGTQGETAFGLIAGPASPGIWMSPRLGLQGLTPLNAGSWIKVWDAAQYEPDPAVLKNYDMGDLESLNGWLYYGTMHKPGNFGVNGFREVYGDPADLGISEEEVVEKTVRAFAIFRARNFDDPGSTEVELLYGHSQLPRFDPQTGSFVEVANVSGYVPVNGPRSSGFVPSRPDILAETNADGYLDFLAAACGFIGPTGPSVDLLKAAAAEQGNPENNYAWEFITEGERLYVGTSDIKIGGPDGFGPRGPYYCPPRGLTGGDLWVFTRESPRTAEPVDLGGFGNPQNGGIRTAVSVDGTPYFGTANPSNVANDWAYPPFVPFVIEGVGGWELLRLETLEAAVE